MKPKIDKPLLKEDRGLPPVDVSGIPMPKVNPPKGQPEPRVPMGDIKDCTCIGQVPDSTYGYVEWVEVRLEHLEPWARAALERGLKAMQEDVL